jgi:hypothetical protein
VWYSSRDGGADGADVTAVARRLSVPAAVCAALLAAAVATGASSPQLDSFVARCELDARATSSNVQQQVRAIDPSYELTADDLTAQASHCSNVLSHATLTGLAACARNVAIRGLRSYARGGLAIADANVGRSRRGSEAQRMPPAVVRGKALLDAGGEQLAVATEVLQGRRHCANGTAARRPMSPATQRLVPELARRAVAMLLQNQRSVASEDAITFGLLLVQLDTGLPPPAEAVQAQIAAFEQQTRLLDRWRVYGLRTFWVRRVSHADFGRRPFTQARFLQAFRDYVTWKSTARGEATNSTTGVVVESEQSWLKVVESWRAEERRWYAPRQASIAAYDALGRTSTARRALLDAEDALHRGG